MTEESLVLTELLEKAGEGDFLRAVAVARGIGGVRGIPPAESCSQRMTFFGDQKVVLSRAAMGWRTSQTPPMSHRREHGHPGAAQSAFRPPRGSLVIYHIHRKSQATHPNEGHLLLSPDVFAPAEGDLSTYRSKSVGLGVIQLKDRANRPHGKSEHKPP